MFLWVFFLFIVIYKLKKKGVGGGLTLETWLIYVRIQTKSSKSQFVNIAFCDVYPSYGFKWRYSL